MIGIMNNLGGTAPKYWDAVAGLDAFGVTVKGLIAELLRTDGVTVHTIDHRVKTEESAKKKINAPGSGYEGYTSLHDLLGLRITCYFSDDVDKVAALIEREFHVDPGMSVDKGKILGPKEFGYRSVHRVAHMSPQRTQFPEYRRFRSMQFEVQIRSVLQHAWAEIEHDLGYKQESIPEPLSRRFSMLAGVLELVDFEFMALRDEVVKYEDQAEEAAKTKTTDMGLDLATLASIFRHDQNLASLDAQVAAAAGRGLDEGEPDSSDLVRRVRGLRELGVTTINELRQAVEAWRAHIVAFVPKWLEEVAKEEGGDWGANVVERPFPRGIGLFYLWLVMSTSGPNGLSDPDIALDDPDATVKIWAETLAEVGPHPALPPRPRYDTPRNIF